MEKIKYFLSSIYQSTKRTSLIKNSLNSNLNDQYHLFIKNLRHLQHTRQYRQAISEIEKNYSTYESLQSEIYKLYIIKAQCILKILSHKLTKYTNELINSNSNKTRSILFWFNHLFLVLEQLVMLFRYANLTEESILNKVEYIIQIHLDTLYHLALFHKQTNNITQMCSYFAMVDNIKNALNYCRHPRTLNLYRKMYLLRAVTLIGNQDYDNSLKYQKICVDISFREFFLVVDFDEGLEEQKQFNKEVMIKKILKRNFIDMIIAFYLRGVCYEYLSDLPKSIEAYKQIKWFSLKFVNESEPELALFCERLTQRAMLYYTLLKELYYNKVKNERNKKRKENQRNMRIKQSLLSSKGKHHKQIKSNEIYRSKQDYNNNDNSVNSIECSFCYNMNRNNNNNNTNMKEATHPKTQYIMSTVKLINTLLEKDYMPILNEMNTIEINKYDKEINKKIILRQNEMNLTKRNKQSLVKRIPSSSSSKCLIFSGPNVSTLLHNSNTNINNNSNISMNRTSLKKYKQYTHISFSPSVRYHPTKIQKLKYDNEQFSKEYIQKKNYLEKVNKKETEFLKKILESKKVEKNFHVKPPDPLKMAKEAQNAFTLGLSLAKTNDTRSALQKIIEDTKIHINDIINNKFQCLSTKQLSKKASFVDSKDKFVIKSERQRRRSCEDEVDEKNSLSHNYFKLKKYVPPDLSNSNIVSKLNNDMIKKLNLEYEMLSQKGNSLNDKKFIYYSKDMLQHK
jgi:hypothetical protein